MSIKSMRRESRVHERGMVLLSVLVLAILYFALMQLILLESSEKMRSAQRFRSRIVADLLAEDSLELAAEQMVNYPARTINQELTLGTASGQFSRLSGNRFRLEGTGTLTGAVNARVTIEMTGRIRGSQISVETYSYDRNQTVD